MSRYRHINTHMSEFKAYHPFVNFVYFLFVIGFSMFSMHPLCLCISLICGFTFSAMSEGKKTIKRNLIYMIPVFLLTAMVNPLFNHEGVTIITYIGNNPLTLESIIYGIGAACMIISVILWFLCYGIIMTSDKFIYLFGKLIPSLSLILSITLRFVQRFLAQFKIVANAQRCIGRNPISASPIKKIKYGLTILSIVVSWALENAIETADSMRSRGYGIPGRTAFSIFRFDKRDVKALVSILFFGIYTLVGCILGAMYFRYFPSIKASEVSVYSASVFFAYFLLCMCPIIIEVSEVRKWTALRLKI